MDATKHTPGPWEVEFDDGGHEGEVLAFRHGVLCVNVRPWIGSWENGYPHSNDWLYPVAAVRIVAAARLRGEEGGA